MTSPAKYNPCHNLERNVLGSISFMDTPPAVTIASAKGLVPVIETDNPFNTSTKRLRSSFDI